MNLNQEMIRTDHVSVPLQDFSCSSGGVECVFKNLERRLVAEISRHDYVFGCVAWLTHPDILRALATRRGVCVVVQKEDFLRPDGDSKDYKSWLRARYDELTGIDLITQLSVCSSNPALGAVRCCGIGGKKNRPRCHHKFLVFVDQMDGWCRASVVWTGSFNFSKNAVASFENAVLINDEGIARAYLREFEQVVALSEPLDWAHEYVEPEYRIGT